MSGTTTTIYVSLLDENVIVRRPVNATHIGGDEYVITKQPYDREVERWAFEPGDHVIVEELNTAEGSVLAAVRFANR